MSGKMTQNEARGWRKRALAAEKQLQDQRSSWAEDWPNGIQIAAIDLPVETFSAIRTARKLRHAVVASDVGMNTNRVVFFGLPLA